MSAIDGEREDIESIELELDELQGNVLDAMPSGGPVRWRVVTENRHTVDLDPCGCQHGAVEERRASAAEGGRDHDE